MTSADIDALWDFGDPATSEARFRELAEGLDYPFHAEALTQVARALGLQGKFDEAETFLDEASHQGDMAGMRATLERGRLRNSGGDRDGASRLFVEALRQAEALGTDFYAVDAAHMLGIACDGDDALEWTRTAISIATESPDPRAQGWLGSLYNNLGWNLHDLGRYDEALEIFERALALRQEQGDPERIHQARWCIARCLRSLGRVEEALAIQEHLTATHPKDIYVDAEIVECRRELGLSEA
ncbi:MAG: tetratricopeptide repeat protein [Fimbriimonas sp.]